MLLSLKSELTFQLQFKCCRLNQYTILHTIRSANCEQYLG